MSGSEQPIILLAEDSDDDTFIFRRTLAKSGEVFRLFTVNNGSDAVEFLRRASQGGDPTAPRPQIIFLDLKMPQLSGFDVLDWVRKQHFLPPLRIVVLSGSDEKRDKMLALELGAAEFITKPISIAELKRLLKELPHP
jgi:CheY-like chemotaxis protein